MNRSILSALRYSARQFKLPHSVRHCQSWSMDSFQPEEGFVDRAKHFYVFDLVEPDVFRTERLATTRQGSAKAAFGGLIFSQALAAAENTVEFHMKPHAMHSFFILNVDTELPVEYHVRRTRDGRSFCTRSVEAIQGGKIAFTLQVSFHALEKDCAVHQDQMPSVPHYSKLVGLNEAVPDITEKVNKGELVIPKAVEKRLRSYDARAHRTNGDLFEIRPVDIGKHFGYSGDNSTTFYNWFRTRGDLCDCEKIHRCLIAYNTDSTLAGSVFRPHFKNNLDPSMIFSLDHCVWMHHHDVRADEWLLFEHNSSIAGRGRGFSQGRIWREDGTLVLSCTQEVLVRGRGEVSRL